VSNLGAGLHRVGATRLIENGPRWASPSLMSARPNRPQGPSEQRTEPRLSASYTARQSLGYRERSPLPANGG